jgi:hypothetical protein
VVDQKKREMSLSGKLVKSDVKDVEPNTVSPVKALAQQKWGVLGSLKLGN